jgi:hypothetical protein
VWGPQQNAVVDGQFDAAQDSEVSAAHRRRVRDVAERVLDSNERPDDGSE